ncbi:MAG: putative phosphoesterase [Desulforhopalus sp.]|jgi:putative phosphoesterase
MTTLAILSDTHDQIANLRAAIDYCNEVKVDVVAHCGDLISPFMLKQLARFKGDVHLIYGNNIGDQRLIGDRCGREFPNINHHGILGKFKIDNYTIAMVHYPDQAQELASEAIYDIVCCGHSHVPRVQQFEHTLLINPGQLLGENDQAGFVIVDLTAGTTQRIGVGKCMFDQEIAITTSNSNTIDIRVQSLKL